MKKKTIKYLTIVLSLILFIAIIFFINTTSNNFIDDKVYNFISVNMINDNTTKIIKIITNLVNPIFIIILTIILIVIIKNKKISITIIINLILSFLLNNLLKIIFKRPRPDIYNIITEKGYSFPSGHSMISCAYYGFLIYLVMKYIENKKLKYILITILSLIIFGIGISRIYLGVHYTTDVIGGYSFAIFYLLIFINYIDKYIEERSKEE